jgi:glycosyltransferase involved in cell wall biosynthesis
VHVIRSDGHGALAARRRGVEAAQGEILAFTDSDCRPTPAWLEAVVGAIDDGADMVNGLTQPARPPGPMERSIGSGLEGLYPTCNMAFRREAYAAAGGSAADRLGFRPTSRARRLGFGEDTLLGWRVARSAPSRYVPEALVHHHVFEPDLREAISRVMQAGAFPALIREVPELRQTLMHHRWLFGQRDRLAVYVTAVALVLRGPRRRSTAIACGWWIATRWRDLGRSDLPRSERLRLLPAEMLLDVIWCGSLVAGSVRARTLVL